MQHLFQDWNNVKKRIKNKDILFLLDYDGTLAPISKTPTQAFLPIKTRKAIENITNTSRYKVVIISGRSASDLKYMVKLNAPIYVGNHGLEIRDREHYYHVPQSKDLRYALWNTYKILSEKLSDIEGIILENKKFTLSVHYRLINASLERKVIDMVMQILKTPSIATHLKISFGKMVIEIKPISEWNKGTAASFTAYEFLKLNQDEFIPICIGDDITDEDLFIEFKERGLNIKVGKTHDSNAEYYVDNENEVQHFLNCLLNTKKNHIKNEI